MSATIELTTVFLQLGAAPGSPRPPPRADLAVMRALRPSVGFYRYLYDTVGAPWHWYDRRRLDQAELGRVLADDRVAVHVLYAGGVPAGFAELDGRVADELELAYFGLVPAFIGQGLGPYLLDWVVAEARRAAPRRVWVHTCSLDHPGALACYQRAGFVEYARETTRVAAPAPP